MSTPDVAATVASLRSLRQRLQDTVDQGDTIIDTSSNAQVLHTSQVAIDTLEEQGNRFASGDLSPFDDPMAAWQAWEDVAQSTADSLSASIGLNNKWTVTYVAQQVGQQALDNVKSLGLGLGGALLGLAVLFIVLEAR